MKCNNTDVLAERLGKFCLGNRCLDVFKRWRKLSQLLWEQITFLFAISRTWDKCEEQGMWRCEEQGMRKNHKKIISYHFCKSLPVKAEHWNAIKNYSLCPLYLCPQGLDGLIVCLYSDSTHSIISVNPTTSRAKCLQQGLCQNLCAHWNNETCEGSWAPSSHVQVKLYNSMESHLQYLLKVLESKTFAEMFARPLPAPTQVPWCVQKYVTLSISSFSSPKSSDTEHWSICISSSLNTLGL